LTSQTFIRSEMRRARRETEAHMQTLSNETEADVWLQIAPLLDAAMGHLNEIDRHAVVLRFFDGKSMREVGAALGASEDTAKQRVGRAVEKLRTFFTKRGVIVPATVLIAAISANSVQAAPAGFGITIAASVIKGGVASGSTLTIVKGALKIMAWTKMKTAVVVGGAVIFATATTVVVITTREDASELTKKGWELLQAGRRDEATKMFNKAVKRDEKNPEAWNGLGWVSLNSARPAEAERGFQKVLALNPDHLAALNGLGQLYLSQKKYDEAEAYLLKAKQAPAAWFGLARLYLIQGKFESAEEYAQMVVDSGQGNEIATQMLQAAKEKQLSKKLRLMIEPR
jgi:Flp pilus assembly protein TadD